MIAKTQTVDLDSAPQIHQYRLVRILGRGGMGVVYEAQHVRLKRRVALKILPQNVATAPAALERFEREMAAIGQLSHPNIVQALDAGVDNSTHYLAMEYVDGENVETVASQSDPLKIADACEIVRQAALGLAHAHAFGIVHRDVKPSNLLLARSGEVKLADLGLARFTAHGEIEPLTVHGAVIGTYDYMSPEQADGRPPQSASDLYSLGATLYRLLSGRAVFSGPDFDSAARKMAAHLQQTPTSLTTLRPEIPAALDQIVQELLAKDSNERPKSAQVVAERLSPFCKGANLRLLNGGNAPLEISEIHTGSLGSGSTRIAKSSDVTLRMSRRAVRITGLACCGLMILAMGLALNRGSWSSRKSLMALTPGLNARVQEKETFEELAPSELKPGRLYSLLNREPEKLIWEPHVESHLSFDRELRRVHFGSPGLAIIRLGRVESPSYTLQLDLHQNRWPGGFGILLGIRSAPEDGSIEAQGIYFQKNRFADNADNALLILRSRFKIVSVDKDVHHMMTTDDRAVETSTPGGLRRLLELEVKNGRLHELRWGGQRIQDLVSTETNNLYSEEDFRGDFGMYVIQSEVSVASPRITVNAGL